MWLRWAGYIRATQAHLQLPASDFLKNRGSLNSFLMRQKKFTAIKKSKSYLCSGEGSQPPVSGDHFLQRGIP